MSLIVVRKQENKIFIVGDTKLTFPDARNPGEKVTSPLDSIIKATILNRHLCLCFAGDYDKSVDDIIRECRALKMDFQSMLEILLKYNVNKEHKTEFILCYSMMNIGRVWCVKNGIKIFEEHGCWIGSIDGFNQYQESFSLVQKTDMNAMMKDAFSKILINPKDTGVNGFLISVSNISSFFEYDSFIQAYLPDRRYDENSPYKVGKGSFVITYGTAAEGGYTVNVMPSSRNHEILPIYVLQGNFGVIYKTNLGGLLHPELIRDVNEDTFIALLKKKYGIEVGYRIS